MDLFAELGFEGTTISAVERRVGLAAGTGSLHRHFSSKESLLRAAVEREVERAIAAMRADRDALPADLDAVRDFEQCLHDIRRFDRLFSLLLAEGQRFPEVQDAVFGALQIADKDANWGEDPVLVVAVAALGGYHLLGLLQGRPFQGVPEAEFIDTLVRLTVS